ncbi:MAG: ATP-binding cassette domain-containing protein [Polyangiales bacterium]
MSAPLQGAEALPLGATPAARAARSAAHDTKLELRGLRHRFGDLVVLDGISLRVQRGEIFGLLGPNGSGKSTTLRVLTGLLVPQAGEIVLDGEPVAAGGRRLRQQLGVVFQAPSLDPRLTARENLRLGAALYGVPTAVAASRIEELLAFTALRERGDDLVVDFSGGMKRRLELARALLHEPDLLLMDEPTTGLDERFFRQTWERIEALRAERGLTVLLTTHRAEEAERCDRVAVIDSGRVIAEDRPEALRQRVSGDVLTIEAKDPDALCSELAQLFQLQCRVVDGKVVLERDRGHELIPRLVEALPVGRIDSLSMHRPTLADVFVKLTGRSLRDEAVAASEAVESGGKR